MPDWKVEREADGTGGRYLIRSGGDVADLAWRGPGDGTVVIHHTGVPDALRHQGVGLAMLSRAVEDFRREGLRIIPACPFVEEQFRRHPEWTPLLADGGAEKS